MTHYRGTTASERRSSATSSSDFCSTSWASTFHTETDASIQRFSNADTASRTGPMARPRGRRCAVASWGRAPTEDVDAEHFGGRDALRSSYTWLKA